MYDFGPIRFSPTRTRKQIYLNLLVSCATVLLPCASTAQIIPFDLEHPSEVFDLPRRLTEISDLALTTDGFLVAIQDEDGILFFIDPETGVVTDEVRFESGGDYEGIEVWGDDIFVLRSDGTVFRIADLGGSGDPERPNRTESEKIKSSVLGHRCDAEGFTTNPDGTALWIACKERPGKGIDHARAIYAFDPNSGKTSPEPVLLISRKMLQDNTSIKKSDFNSFKPASITVHPDTGDIYVISSVDRLLLIMTDEGDFIASHQFDRDLLRQPEGLAFGPDGSLFISSEGAGKRPRLVRFSPIRQ